MSMKILGDIAEIRTGYTFREKIEELAKGKGNAHVVQIKDARKAWDDSNSAQLSPGQLPEILWDGKNKAFAQAGSVLLAARGGYFRACYLVMGEANTRPVVVSSQFLVLIPKGGVLPEYLCWALNQPSMQRYLEEIPSQGSKIAMLSAAAAKQLELAIPTLATQHKILQLNQLWQEEQQLTKALLKNRETMLQGMFQQLLEEDKK